MHYEWLKKKSAERLIVIFSGWGFSAQVFDHLLENDEGSQYDVLYVSDYRDLNVLLPDMTHYQERYLLAWSFGVAAFATWLSKLPQGQQQTYRQQFDRFVAINGSMQPVDRYHGIPDVIMKKTIDTLIQTSFEYFARRCFGDLPMPDDLQINVAEKKQELRAILSRTHQTVSIWNLVWIANHDKIFPPKNLSRAWHMYNENCQEAAVIQYCDAPHTPFQIWSNWNDFISPSI